MRALVQRVSRAEVRVDGSVVASIGTGLCVFVGVTHGDTVEQARHLAQKLHRLRVFPDDGGRMERALADVRAGVLVVSQFTLYGDTRRGRRPSWAGAAPADRAAPLVEELAGALGELGVPVATGSFGAMMEVELVNDGPVTLLLEV